MDSEKVRIVHLEVDPDHDGKEPKELHGGHGIAHNERKRNIFNQDGKMPPEPVD